MKNPAPKNSCTTRPPNPRVLQADLYKHKHDPDQVKPFRLTDKQSRNKVDGVSAGDPCFTEPLPVLPAMDSLCGTQLYISLYSWLGGKI